MSTFPYFSNIAGYVQETLKDRVNNPSKVSKLNAWVKVISAVKSSSTGKEGLVLYSNPNISLFKAAGDNAPDSIYGTSSQAGALGVDWAGSAVTPPVGVGLRPSPIIESISIDEGAGNLSRKAEFAIKCFTLQQMELVTQYFLEPGFTIFLEWGWNTDKSAKGITALNASDITDHQNFDILSEKRKKTAGTYDNYLGFITGGSVDVSGEIWTVNVKCTGFTELPAYLINGDNGGNETNEKDAQKLIDKKAKANEYQNLSSENDLNKKRWMFAYNALPSNRKTLEIKKLATKTDDSLRVVPMAQAVNYINFDETVTDIMNAKADGTAIGRALDFGGATESSGDSSERIALPGGADIFGSEKFIRFGALIKIMNTIIADSYNLGKTKVKLAIDSSNTICSAYNSIFSTRKDKLFIPNPETPMFSFVDAKNSTEPLTKVPTEINDCSVTYKNLEIKFPSSDSIDNGIIQNYGNICYADGYTTNNMGVNKDPKTWGFLDDLYVNFEFASDILSTSNLNIKDALYQILNGMSSAVNDLWNFQIIESQAPEGNKWGLKKGTPILVIRDMNLTYKDKGESPYVFNLIGTNSIFKEAAFNMEMSGAKMNQVIGNRLGNQMGTETQPFIGKLFSEGNTDLILQEMETRKENSDDSLGGDGKTKETDKELKEKNYQNFLGKLGTYPKVELEKKDVESGFVINKVSYVAVYDDAQLLKLAKSEQSSEVSPILPIKFSFTINGVSGIKRGDKFKVKGIPTVYFERGFFQVTSVKQIVQGMSWDTEVEGQFRNLL